MIIFLSVLDYGLSVKLKIQMLYSLTNVITAEDIASGTSIDDEGRLLMATLLCKGSVPFNVESYALGQTRYI